MGTLGRVQCGSVPDGQVWLVKHSQAHARWELNAVATILVELGRQDLAQDCTGRQHHNPHPAC
jgi:hypothetical protein